MKKTKPYFRRHRLSTIVSQVLSAGAASGLAAGVAMAATLTVNTTADNTNDDAFCTLREAVETINGSPPNDNCGTGAAGDTIAFSLTTPATITLNGTDIDILQDMTIQGLGASDLTISGNNQSRIFYIDNTSTVYIHDVTLTEGNATGSSPDDRGGAIFIANGSTLMISDSTVSSSWAGLKGGGILNNIGTATLTDTTVSGNSASQGGGIETFEGYTTLVNTTVSGNSADTNGGGVENNIGNATLLINSTVSGNSAGFGGGINNFRGNATLINTTVTDNSASIGGGVLNNEGNTTLINSQGNRIKFQVEMCYVIGLVMQ